MREGWGGMRASLARPDERVGQRVHNKLRAFSKQLAHPKTASLLQRCLKRFLGFARDFGSGLKRPLGRLNLGRLFLSVGG